jgi:hypothetical protein
MAREFEQHQFFDAGNWQNVFYSAQIILEYYLADVLMKSDMSRVQWSSDAYAFRRRFELADSENGGNYETLGPSSLKLPFVNYWYENGKFWEPDDRPFSVNSQQMLKGDWDVGMPARLYAIAVKTPIIGTVYYSTDVDARLAYERLLWERQPKGPIQLSTTVKWKGVELGIPVFITFESVNFNPKFNETDWLKTQRMYPMQFVLTLRTYAIYYPHQKPIEGVNLSPTRPMPPYSTGARNSTGILGDDNIYLTESVLLNFATLKQWGISSLTPDEKETEEGIIQDMGKLALPLDTLATDLIDGAGNQVQFQSEPINGAVVDIVGGYFTAATDVFVNECAVDPTTITPTSFTINWVIRKPELQYLQDVTIYVPGQAPIQITDARIKDQVITGVYPNSEYHVIVLFHSTNGSAKDFHLLVNTANDPINPVPLKVRRGKLKGMTF